MVHHIINSQVVHSLYGHETPIHASEKMNFLFRTALGVPSVYMSGLGILREQGCQPSCSGCAKHSLLAATASDIHDNLMDCYDHP